MTLQQLSPEKRILFLKLFTAELIKAVYQEQHSKNAIKIEKLKQRFIQPNLSTDLAIKQTMKSPVFQPSKYPIEESEYSEAKQLPPHRTFHRMKIRPIYLSQPAKPLKKPFVKKLKKIIRKQQAKPQSEQQVKAQTLQQIQPEYKPKPMGFNLGKIEIFFNDLLIQSIECPGPEKNILIKKANKISPTRMTLSQSEINNVINMFSEHSKIPITGGILKAAVSNLVISAVISEFVGSRFIINRIAPPLIQPAEKQPIQIQQQSPERNAIT